MGAAVDLMRKTKAQLVALIEDQQADNSPDIGPVEVEINEKLAKYGQLSGFARIHAALALQLARVVDQRNERGTAAAAKELHAVLKSLEVALSDDDDGDKTANERDELSTPV